MANNNDGNNTRGVLEWKSLNPSQLGRYALSLVKQKFESLGFRVILFHNGKRQRFYVEGVKNKRLEIQVSSLRRDADFQGSNTRICTAKHLFNIDDDNLYMAAVVFEIYPMPEIYLIPAAIWQNPLWPFDSKTYPKALPDYGIKLSANWREDLKDYEIAAVVKELHTNGA
jgi:hypothetical protein